MPQLDQIDPGNEQLDEQTLSSSLALKPHFVGDR